MELNKISIQDVLGNLPDIEPIDFKSQFSGKKLDLFIQAVGFEERTVGIAKKLSEINNSKVPGIKIAEAVLIKYETNVEDNLFHEKQLHKLLSSFTDLISPLDLNQNFDETIRNKISSLISAKKELNVLLDISTMSSRLILLFTKILFQENIRLTILFTEAEKYYPTEKQFKSMQKDDKVAKEQAQTFGVGKVSISPDYNGGAKESQDLVICFPSFTPERTEAIITTIDDLIIKQQAKDRLIWIVGDPHFEITEEAKKKRQKIQTEINKIGHDHMTFTVCTFEYKKTLEVLDHIYKDVSSKYHVNISDLGSKMQSLGIALFGNLRRDVSVYYSEPVKYNSTYYSEGIKDHWMINVGYTSEFLKELFRVDTIELKADQKKN